MAVVGASCGEKRDNADLATVHKGILINKF
jgi:hypothetical protein